MIDVRAEIEKANKNFISIYNFIRKVNNQVSGNQQDVCVWIIQELTKSYRDSPFNFCILRIDEFHRVSEYYDEYQTDLEFIERKFRLVIKNRDLPVHSEEYDYDSPFDWIDDDFFNFGFSVSELQTIFPTVDLSQAIPKPEIAWNLTPQAYDTNTSADIEKQMEPILQIEWEKRFAGRAAALDIIGAISKILVEKSGNKYQHGENVSANAIADSVVEMMDTINKNKSPENYRKLIGEALKISGLSTEE